MGDVMNEKPRFKIISGLPVSIPSIESKVDIARRRFGQKFSWEPGSTWTPHAVPVLTEWLQNKEKKCHEIK
jgi:hypothetical protein